MDDLYHGLLMEHNRAPLRWHGIAGWTQRAVKINRSCGDEIELQARIAEGRLVALGWRGQGCALMRASASILGDWLEGGRVEWAIGELKRLEAAWEEGAEVLAEVPDAVGALQSVRQYPGRIQCARLPYTALVEVLAAGL